jgi:asparagine synthase (glutamine-hydrolysing)
MCGISGMLRLDGGPADPDQLDRMIATLRHRGPDASGIHISGAAGLAHARLSIIDLQSGGQPMSTVDGRFWITFNGEIFNYVELTEELKSKGHRFATRSDTEVILEAYREYGEECVNHFNGQWAFAIWDTTQRKLFLSRDRMGVRPIFHTVAGRSFLFASEIKALLVHPSVKPELDCIALDQIFTFWCTLPPRTAFRGIQELAPGHSLTVKNGEIKVYRYWQYGFDVEENERSEESLAEELADLLLDATRIRLRADVPVGAYLSGGIDSTVIASLAKQSVGDRLKTFSIGFESFEHDESSYQNDAVEWLKTEHHSVLCTNADICQDFPEMIRHTETPILRTAPVPLFRLSRLVHENGYKVVLTGEGSDEILGGYDIFKEAKIRRFWAAFPDSTRRPLLLKRLYPYMNHLQDQGPAYLKAFFRLRPEDISSLFFSHLPRWELTARLKTFFSQDVLAGSSSHDRLADLEASLPCHYWDWNSFQQAQYLETTCLLPGYILSSQGDRAAMAHSVEGRYPFLDHRVVDFAARVPPRLKMKVLKEKYILKQAAGDRIPPSIKDRPKQPYRAPDAASFFGPEGKARQEYVENLLSADRIRQDGVFDPRKVEKLVEKARLGHAIGVKDNMAVVGILSTQIWIDHFIRRPYEDNVSRTDQ